MIPWQVALIVYLAPGFVLTLLVLPNVLNDMTGDIARLNKPRWEIALKIALAALVTALLWFPVLVMHALRKRD